MPTVFTAAMGGIDMESESGAHQVLDAIASPALTDTDRFRMTTIILKLASDAARQILEAMMATAEYKKTLIERVRDQSLAEGKAEDLVKLLDARGLTLTDEQRQRVGASTDPAQLNRWFDRALTAATVAEVFTD